MYNNIKKYVLQHQKLYTAISKTKYYNIWINMYCNIKIMCCTISNGSIATSQKLTMKHREEIFEKSSVATT
jgi:hypothetical protein